MRITNISPEASDEDLRKLLGFYGKVERFVRNDEHRSENTAFAIMASTDIAKEAVSELNGAAYKGKVLQVVSSTPLLQISSNKL